MKRDLLPAFSTKALGEQETIVQDCVDGFVDVLRTDAGAAEWNMTEWFEMIAFDILGEMAFGESFHCIEDSALGWSSHHTNNGLTSHWQESHTSGSNSLLNICSI